MQLLGDGSFVFAAITLLVAYIIRGATGFGSALIAVPVLALFLPLQFVVPLILVLDFTSSVVLSRHSRDDINWRELFTILPFCVFGIMIGGVLLINLPKEPLLLGLAGFVIFFGIRNVFKLGSTERMSRWWACPLGLTGGTVGALFGTGGPPCMIYLSRRLPNKAQIRATFSSLFMIDSALRVVVFLSLGLFFQDTMLYAILASLPIMALGLVLGHKIHQSLSDSQLIQVIGILLLLSGIALIGKTMS